MTIKQKFKSAIKRGTGEAHLLMQKNSKVNFSNDIIKAALKNLSYDNQSEGSRAVYIFELIERSNQKEKIRQAVLKGLATEKTDSWALNQLFDITALWAKKGDQEARKALYKRFYTKVIQGSEWVGQDAIIEVDGLDGIKHIAKIKGRIIQNNPEELEDSFIIDHFQQKNPTINVYNELKKSSKNNRYIKTYLHTILKHKHSISNLKKTKYNYTFFTDKINSKANIYLSSARIKELSKSDVMNLAKDFLKETNRLKKEKYMQIFNHIKFPYDYHPILKLAKTKNNGKGRLVEYACGALKYFSGKAIRKFAIEKLKKTSNPCNYLDLLVCNYKKVDNKLLVSIAKKYKSEHTIHSLALGYINIYKANATKECVTPLTIIYNKLTCGLHRKDIVKIMLDNNVLPNKIRKELKYDSNEAIRTLEGNESNNRNQLLI